MSLLAEELVEVLWRERGLLENCLFKVEVENLLLRSGRTAWLSRACGEVESVLAEARRNAVVRSTISDALAAELGLPAGASLLQFAQACAEPWPSILLDHHRHMLDLCRQLTDVDADNRALVRTTVDTTRFVPVHDQLVRAFGTEAVQVTEMPERINTRRIVTLSLQEFLR